MSLEKKLETVLNSAKVRLVCTRHPEDKTVIVVEVQRDGKTLFGAMTNDDGARELLKSLDA